MYPDEKMAELIRDMNELKKFLDGQETIETDILIALDKKPENQCCFVDRSNKRKSKRRESKILSNIRKNANRNGQRDEKEERK